MSLCIKEDLRLGAEHRHPVCQRAPRRDKLPYFNRFRKRIGPIGSSREPHRIVLEEISLLPDDSKQHYPHEYAATDDAHGASLYQKSALLIQIINPNAN